MLQQALPKVRDPHGGRALLSPEGRFAAREGINGARSPDAVWGSGRNPQDGKTAEGDCASTRKATAARMNARNRSEEER